MSKIIIAIEGDSVTINIESGNLQVQQNGKQISIPGLRSRPATDSQYFYLHERDLWTEGMTFEEAFKAIGKHKDDEKKRFDEENYVYRAPVGVEQKQIDLEAFSASDELEPVKRKRGRPRKVSS